MAWLTRVGSFNMKNAKITTFILLLSQFTVGWVLSSRGVNLYVLTIFLQYLKQKVFSKKYKLFSNEHLSDTCIGQATFITSKEKGREICWW